MKKIIKLTESDLNRIIRRVMSEGSDNYKGISNYMFFSNLEQIKRQCEELLEMDPKQIEDILNNGHDWADDHIATAKENMDQVYDFLINETKNSGDMWSDDKEEMSEDLSDLASAIDSKDNVDSYEANIAASLEEGRKKSGTKLCSRGKSAARAKFKVYPSAYANGYGIQVCKGRMPGTDGKKRCSPPYC